MDVPVELLQCPVTGQAVRRAPDNVLTEMMERQKSGTLHSRGGDPVEPFDGGLLTTDGAWLYPIRSGIPVMLPGEAIALAPP